MLRSLLVLILLTGGLPPVSADSLPTREAARALTDSVVAAVASGDFEGGLRLMQPYSVVPAAEFESAMAAAREQWPEIERRFGAPVGHELIRDELAGKSIYRVVQILKFERHATRFMFVFYRPRNAWFLNTYSFDDQLQGLFCD